MLAAATAVGGLALSGLLTAGAASASIHGSGTHGPGSWSFHPDTGSHAIGRITAASTRNRDFAGYDTGVTAGSATSSAASFTVPKLSCTTTDRVIAPDVGVAANKNRTESVAGVSIGCANGKAVYFPFLIANRAETNYATVHFSAGDVINLSASVTTSGITVQVTDVTKNVSVATTITGAGASPNAAWIGDDSWYSNSGNRLGVPNFGKLTFTNCLIDGTALGGWHPQAYQRVNGRGTVEIATGGPWPGGTAFNTLYRNS
jgi:hypothetical protein